MDLKSRNVLDLGIVFVKLIQNSVLSVAPISHAHIHLAAQLLTHTFAHTYPLSGIVCLALRIFHKYD